ncbi:dipeptidase PepV, partial [Streptococcus danieliae]|nr:dipeptidase PepV [Streptococcus danieliae]
LGINGATYLAAFLANYAFTGAAKAYLDLAGRILKDDHDARALGLAFVDERMGALSMNAGVFRFEKDSDQSQIALNFRYPQGLTPEEIQAKLAQVSGVQVSLSEHGHTPHY